MNISFEFFLDNENFNSIKIKMGSTASRGTKWRMIQCPAHCEPIYPVFAPEPAPCQSCGNQHMLFQQHMPYQHYQYQTGAQQQYYPNRTF